MPGLYARGYGRDLGKGYNRVFSVIPGTPVYIWAPPEGKINNFSFKGVARSPMVLGTQYDDACGGVVSDPQLTIPAGSVVVGETSEASARVAIGDSTNLALINVLGEFESGECVTITSPGGSTIYADLVSFEQAGLRIYTPIGDDDGFRNTPDSLDWVEHPEGLLTDGFDETYYGTTVGFKLEALGATITVAVSR